MPRCSLSFNDVEWTESHNAVEREDLVRLRELLDAGNDVEDDDGSGWSLLCHAIDIEIDGHDQTGKPLYVDVNALLVAHRGDPPRTRDGITVLMEAERRGHWLAVEVMKAWIDRPR